MAGNGGQPDEEPSNEQSNEQQEEHQEDEQITVQYGYVVKPKGKQENRRYGSWEIATRAQVIALKAFGHSNEEIADKLDFKRTGLSRSTVYNIWKRAKERGFDPDNPIVLDVHVKDAHRSGRPRKPREGRDRCRCKRILCQRCLEDRATRVHKRPRAKKGTGKGKARQSQGTSGTSSGPFGESMHDEDADMDVEEDDGAPIPDDQLPIVPQDDVDRLLQIYRSVSIPLQSDRGGALEAYSGQYLHAG